MKKTLYERRKGKEFKASGSWKLDKREDITIKIIAVIFAAHIILALLFMFLGKKNRNIFLCPDLCLDVCHDGLHVLSGFKEA